MRVVQNLAASNRWKRQPSHAFQVRHRPFQIQPVALAPVLPGETITNALFQVRAVTSPVKSPLAGWWYEVYLFYVKHRDMPDSALWQNMVLQPGADVSTGFTGQDKKNTYHGGEGIDWADQCLRAVVPHYFRDDGETYDVCMLDGLPMAKVNVRNWSDSVLTDTQMPDGAPIPATGNTAGGIDLLLQQWQLLREAKLTTATYEEFLASYGVRAKLAEPDNKPELVRYVRDWSYPSNTVDPLTGNPTSAISWSIAERADKDRFLPEPGFLFAVAVLRPKVYFGKQTGAMSSHLTDAFAWLPAVLRDEPATSLRKFAANTGPIRNAQEPYYVDARDLFMYGDQFSNLVGMIDGAIADPAAAAVGLPDVGAGYTNSKYIFDSGHLDALFNQTYAAGGGAVRVDGVITLTVKTSVHDATASSPAANSASAL